MKKIVLILSGILLISTLSAQSLMDIYKKGTVKLVPDTEYAKNNDWEKIFESYSVVNRSMDHRKSVIMKPDGSLVINHPYKNYYSLFDQNGKFVKDFGIKNSSGKQFKNTKPIKGIMNNTFYTELDNMGKMTCFDFNGNYIKTLTLNYMTWDMIPLKNNKIAVVGWVIWSTKFRDFVAIVDYNTNEEKIIWEYFTDRCEDNGASCKLFNYSYNFESGGSIRVGTMPYTNDVGLSSHPVIEFVNDRLIVAIPSTGEILAYDINGNLKTKEKIEWASNYISVEEQKEIQRKAITEYRSKSNQSPEMKKAMETITKQMEDDLSKIKDPIKVPVFSTIIKDSDDNLLFFEMPKEKGANKFNVWVYKNNGQFVAQSNFVCDDYNLSITPSKMVFHNGYIYSIQQLKEAKGNPLRLVRFKLTN